MGFALLVTLTGLFIVFAALIFLALCIGVMGKVIGGFKKKPTDNNTAVKAETKKEEAVKASAPAKVVADGEIPGEVLAAISAAVAMMMDGKPFVVRSVQRSKSSRPAWAMAGIVENTRPF